MTSWLDPLRETIDAAGGAVDVFFRDDDAGWDDDALWRLLDRFRESTMPLDVAVIPSQLTTSLADRLVRAAAASGAGIAFSQHGWAHVNHEREGRKCEFGASRAPDEQRADVERGRAVMVDAFGKDGASCFVPPWNRCTATTGRVLVELGFRLLSRDSTAAPLHVDGLPELPITVDWFARRRGERVDRGARGVLLARAASGGRIGLMLHHTVMGEDDLADLGELLRLLAGSGAVRASTIGRLARHPGKDLSNAASGAARAN